MTIEKYLEVLFQTNRKTYDFKLTKNEYIRLIAIKNDGYSLTKYVKTAQEIKDFIKKYKQIFNIYIGLSTTNGKNNTADYIRKRQVIFLDFDKKDYPQYTNLEQFTRHIKSKLPLLYNHMIVDSGNGYHFYIAIETTTDQYRVLKTTEELIKILGADPKANLITQIVRLPTSLNLKDEKEKKSVNIVSNTLESTPKKFKPYQLNTLDAMIQQQKNNKEIEENITPLQPKKYDKVSSYHCIEAMLNEGASQGERNFCLGRITKYLQLIKGLQEQKALEKVLEWNRRCQPPKPESVIKADFKAYWKKPYKLLGCKVPDEKDQAIIDRFCNKYLCNSIFEVSKGATIEEAKELMFDSKLLKNKLLQEFTGHHYMILSVMQWYNKPMTKKALKTALTGRKDNKCCISDNTLRKVLSELITKKYILYEYNTYYLNIKKGYSDKYIKYYYVSTIQLINKIITPTEYEVYLCLLRNLQQNKNADFETIAESIGTQKQNLTNYIRGLNKAGLLIVEDSVSDKGGVYKTYKITA